MYFYDAAELRSKISGITSKPDWSENDDLIKNMNEIYQECIRLKNAYDIDKESCENKIKEDYKKLIDDIENIPNELLPIRDVIKLEFPLIKGIKNIKILETERLFLIFYKNFGKVNIHLKEKPKDNYSIKIYNFETEKSFKGKTNS